MAKTLWERFNLAEKNPDRGGGILYCLRYDYDRINAHRECIVAALKSMKFQLEEVDGGIAAVPEKPLTDHEGNKAYILLEELSVLNEAQEYIEAGYGYIKNIEALKDRLVSHYLSVFSKSKNLIDAYNFVDMVIPEIVHDIRVADAQNGILSNKEKKTLDDLLEFSKRQTNLLNARGGLAVIG
ncbi:hypothetical protein HYU07_04910 [Candidatus Woesearchaeota archaeon]|nr:hypothetical protein [Candidatus Woesearchaeota archaeon]